MQLEQLWLITIPCTCMLLQQLAAVLRSGVTTQIVLLTQRVPPAMLLATKGDQYMLYVMMTL